MRRAWLCAVVLVAALPARSAPPRDADDEAAVDVPSRLEAPPLTSARPLKPEDDLLSLATLTANHHLTATFHGEPKVLTIDVALQQELTDLLKTYQVPWGAVVVMEPSTGRVLAMAEHSEEQPELTGLCTKALYPAASLFKVVTARALLDVGVSKDDVECVHGGFRKLTPSLLEPSPDDGRCLTLADAMGQSANVVFARWTAKVLDPHSLAASAKALHFNQSLPFPVPTEPSLAKVPSETFELAATGAGFGDVYLSPLHGAALAASLANRGVWRAPVLFESDVAQAAPERVLTPQAAAALVDMLQKTVTEGTGRRIFHERHLALPDAAGKTGSLSDKRPFRDYSWFMGFAPVEAPQVAVAAVVVNDPYWRIRGTWLGKEAMRLYLDGQRPRVAAGKGGALDGGVSAAPSRPAGSMAAQAAAPAVEAGSSAPEAGRP